MVSSHRHWDLWSMPTLLLWLVFLAAGLDPEFVFDQLRHAAWVVPHKALVNSSHVITVIFAGYIAMFAFNECRRLRLSAHDSLVRAIQIGVLGVFAFLPLSLTMELWNEANSIYGTSFAVMTYRSLAFSVWPMKLIAWAVLVTTVTRYYLFGNDRAFVTTFSFVQLAPNTDSGPETGNEQLPLGASTTPNLHRSAIRSSTNEPDKRA